MAFPQASDYRPPIIPDGDIYDNPENGKSYYWTQILLPEGSTPDTATSIGGYWTVVCDPGDPIFVLKAGDTMTGALEFDETEEAIKFKPEAGQRQTVEVLRDANSGTVGGGLDVFLLGNSDYNQLRILGRSTADGDKEFFKVGGNEGTSIFSGRVNLNKPVEDSENSEGFVIKGTIANGPEDTTSGGRGNLLNVYHNANAADAINYAGKINSPGNLVNKGYVDDKDDLLRQDIIELEEEIDAIAPSVERGQFISTTDNNAPQEGEFMLATVAGKTVDYGNPDISIIQVSKIDNEGVAHTYADVEDGQLLQLFEDGNADYGLYLIEAVAGNDDPAMTAVTFTVSPVSGLGEATEGDLARLKIFSAPSGGTADGFVLKTGDEMSGKLTFKNNLEDIVLTSADVPSKLTFKNEKSDGTENTLHLWQAGVQTALVTNGDFKVKRSISTGDYIFGWGGENSVLMPRIHMTGPSVDLKYGTTTKIAVGDTYTYYYGKHNFTDSTCRIYARSRFLIPPVLLTELPVRRCFLTATKHLTGELYLFLKLKQTGLKRLRLLLLTSRTNQQ